MFKHSRKSPNGGTIPTWLTSAGQVLVKRCARTNKPLPLVEEADVIEVNPDYSIVRLKDGRETSVSNRHLAPIGNDGGERIRDVQSSTGESGETQNDQEAEFEPPDPSTSFDPPRTPVHKPESPLTIEPTSPSNEPDSPTMWGTPDTSSHSGTPESQPEIPLRRSCRIRRTPQYLQDFTF